MAADQAEALMRDLRWLAFGATSSDISGARLSLGNNVIGENCDSLPMGGNVALSRALTESLQQGLRCFKDLGPARGSDIARLLGYLDPAHSAPVRIQCVAPGFSGRGPWIPEKSAHTPIVLPERSDGMAFLPGDADFPGLMLNIKSKADFAEFKSTLFHELLHLLGYTHSDAVDVPYLAEACCFSKTAASKDACGILGDPPLTPQKTTDTAYQRRIARILIEMRQPFIAIQSAWQATLNAPSETADRPTTPLMAVALKLLETPSDRSKIYLMMAYAGAAATLPSSQKSTMAQVAEFPLPQVQHSVTRPLGEALGALLRRDTAEFLKLWPAANATRRAYCQNASANEKIDFQRITEKMKVIFPGAEIELPPQVLSQLSRPCDSTLKDPN